MQTQGRRSELVQLHGPHERLSNVPFTARSPRGIHRAATQYLTDRFTGGPPKQEPLKQWVPLVEFDFDTPAGWKTAATANPGLSYVAVTWQAAGEAIVPLNQEAGRGVGFRAQLLFFLHDLAPSLFGKPLLSSRPVPSHVKSGPRRVGPPAPARDAARYLQIVPDLAIGGLSWK